MFNPFLQLAWDSIHADVWEMNYDAHHEWISVTRGGVIKDDPPEYIEGDVLVVWLSEIKAFTFEVVACNPAVGGIFARQPQLIER